jgi:UDP-N-acetylmuramoylalanine--D-glutamate ligase
MTPVAAFAGRRVALFGLGGSGLATALALMAGGAQVDAWDDSEAARAAAAAAGITLTDLTVGDWSTYGALVLAPGVPLTHPVPHWSVTRARAAGLEIIGDIELFCRERARTAPDAPFVAITGTNGKSTSTALLAHVLAAAGHDVQMGGNIGTAVLSLAPPAAGRVHVVECSSFQIDLAPSLNPTVGIVLNITPDHLDRHGTMDNYAAVKERLIAGADTAVIGVDDAWCQAMAARRAQTGRPLIPISVERVLTDGLYARGSQLVWASEAGEQIAADLAGNGSLRGLHNAQNAAAVVAAGTRLGLTPRTLAEGLRGFPGLAHRMEQVARRGPVLFINDSKATNADAAEKALASFADGVFWIVGGVQKEGGLTPLAPYFERVEKAYLIGASSDAFALTLEGRVPYRRCVTLENAVAAAAADAAGSRAAEPVVLLSPACASFDHYRNFEVRGTHFRDLVMALSGIAPMAGG